ncbi:MAG: ribosomal protein S18-alanine N-acetyltransferase [bacterium]
MKIVALEKKDISTVYEIEKLSFVAPKAESVFSEDQHKYLVGKEKEEEKVVGYIGVEKIAGETHIINMAVHPDYRRKGVGKKLIEAILNDSDVFFLEVRISNVAAQKLYEKFGFKNVGTRKKYYQDNGEDAYIMRREVVPIL